MQKLIALIAQAIFIAFATMSQPTALASMENDCPDPTYYSVKLCIDHQRSVYWTGLWDECFNLGTQTA